MRPAEKVALLTALAEAAKKALDAAKAEALDVSAQVGVKSFDTEFGAVTVARKGSAPFVNDPAMFLAYVKHNWPTEVVAVPAVRPSFTTALLGRVKWSPELQEYVDTATGEAVPGVAMSEPGDPYIAWPAGDAQKRTKEEATEWFASRSEQILAGMLSVESGMHGEPG